jgi:hypothetical protein
LVYLGTLNRPPPSGIKHPLAPRNNCLFPRTNSPVSNGGFFFAMKIDDNNPYQRKAHRQPVTRTEAQRTIAVHCDDGSRRPAGRTGKEDAFVEACRQVGIEVVPVLVPKSRGTRGRHQVEAVLGGMQLEKDLTMQEWIGYEVAAQRYSRRTVDACEQTDGARIAKAISV